MTVQANDRYDMGRLRSPAFDAATIAPSDSINLPLAPAKSLYVGVTGNIQVTTEAGSTLTFQNVPVGVLPLRVQRVWSTSTTASALIALY